MYRHITQADSNFYDFHVSLVDNKDKILFCDTETTGLDSRINKLLSLQIYNGSDIFIYDFTKLSNDHLLNIIKLIKNNNIKTVWHNAKFDIKFIYNATGIWLTNIADTMQLEVLINAGRGKSFYSLDELSNKYCNVQLNKAQRDSFLTDNVTELTDQMLNYSAMDVKVLKDIYTKQLEKVVELNEEQVMNLEMGIIWLVANMEYNGVLLDTEKWISLEKQERIRLDDVTSSIKNYISENVDFTKFKSALEAATTFNIPAKTKKLQRELETYISADVIKGWVRENINLASPKQLLTILNLLGIKVDSTDKKVLKKLEKSEFLNLLLEKSECAKRISTYGLSVLEFIHPVSGRIHTDFINMGAATGRFSSGNPLNLQNIPRAEGYHESFIASPGFDFISCDYSQQEFRLAGAISNEKLIIDAYVQGADMHTATAALIYNKPLNEITKEERFVGKSQPLDSKVLTPSGWSTMGNISEGDFVIGYDGKPKRVLKIFPQGMRPIYKIKFSDGSSAECDEDHLWSVKRTSNKGKFKTLSTKQIIDCGIHKFKKDGTKERKFAIPTVKPIDYKEVQNFVLHPYVLGVILGDGNISGNQARISSGDDYIINKFSSLLPNGCSLVYRGKYDYYIYGGNKLGRGNHNPVLKALKDLSLFGTNSETKFIPSIYKYSSVEQRLDLLRGLIDTDGYVNKKGSIIYNSVSEHLINDVIDVVRSLGGFCYKRFKNNNKKGCYEISINIKDVNIVSLPRKLNRVKTQKKWLYRRIDSIEYVSHKEAKCILVDSPDHLYITDDYIVTHNTANFTIIYGGTEYALMKNLGISVEKSRDIIKRFNEGFKTFSAFKENAENKILSMGYSTTLMGRRRHNEERPLFMDSMELLRYESKVKREGFNHIIQGSAADITKLAMLNICNKNPFGDKLRMLIQVHDELDLESHKSITNDAVEFIKQEMLAAEQKFLGDIPAAMDCSVSDCWKH